MPGFWLKQSPAKSGFTVRNPSFNSHSILTALRRTCRTTRPQTVLPVACWQATFFGSDVCYVMFYEVART